MSAPLTDPKARRPTTALAARLWAARAAFGAAAWHAVVLGAAGLSVAAGCGDSGGSGSSALTDGGASRLDAMSPPPTSPGEVKRFDGVLTFTREAGLDGGVTMVNLDLASERLSTPRQIIGAYGTRRASGQFAFAHPCGGGWGVFIADALGTPVQSLLGCADRGGLGHDFYDIQLSPSEDRIALVPSVLVRSPQGTLVLSSEGEELAFFEGYVLPSWGVDGSLFLIGDGLWMSDPELRELTRVDGGQIAGPMGPAAPHPDGQRVAFWYADGIYELDIGTTRLERLLETGEVAAPVWSPDGDVLAFLSWQSVAAERAIYFLNPNEARTQRLGAESFLGEDPTSSFPAGPLSWNDL
jgi:hypothetical protein